MSPFRRKAVENALISVLREQRDVGFTVKTARPLVAELVDGCTPAELAGAIQALRYAGKLEWGSLTLSQSMIETSAGPELTAEQGDGAAPVAPSRAPTECAERQSASKGPEDALTSAASSGPDDEDEYPGDVNDKAAAAPTASFECANCPLADPADCMLASYCPHRDGPRPAKAPGGWRKAANVAGARPVPAPQHESEVARLVREEANLGADRRRRARSTGTVRQPLELRHLDIPDMSLAESVTSLLAEEPADLMLAIKRKHPQLWRRVIMLGRAHDKRPAEALYWAIERGLDELEAGTPAQEAA